MDLQHPFEDPSVSPRVNHAATVAAMASIEDRGSSTRVTWLLGGSRGGAKQSCTFRGDPAGRAKVAAAAKLLVESRRHRITRAEVNQAILGDVAAADEQPVPTFKAWALAWLKEREQSGEIQGDVVKWYRCTLKERVFPFIGHLHLTEINRDVLQAWVGWMTSSHKTIGSKNKRNSDQQLHPNYIRKIYGVVNGCLYAAVPQWIPANPAARPRGAKNVVKLPKAIPFDGMFLLAWEVNLILEHCPADLRDLVFTASRSGLRMGELLALRVENVVFPRAGGATILVRQARKWNGTEGQPKSRMGRRAVPVGEQTAAVLRPRVTGRRPREYVFTAPSGKGWNPNSLRENWWYKAVAAAMRCPQHPPATPPKPKRGPTRTWRNHEVSSCDCAGVLHRRPRFHDLRHTHASWLIDRRWAPKKIQHRLGHADFMTTMNVYGHLMDLGSSQELTDLDDFITAPAPVPVSPAAVAQRAVARSVLRRARRVDVRLVASPR